MAYTGSEDLEKIIQGCIRKNDKSREMLYKQYFGYALSVALLYNNQRDDALEVVNDSFMKVFSEIRRFNTSLPFKGWLRKIVINTSIDRLRKKNRMKNIEPDNEPVREEHLNPDAISNLTAQEIISLLNQLPEVHKTIFCLYEIDGYNHEEIAAKLKIPESSSRVYLTRAKKKMRELLLTHYNRNHI
ncbi:MAG: RNA polymerase sigma factor [Bacteroidales bacterium]|nr:RNA polymerase sigma factor [Bacteroidales bacterium]MDD2426138.1 RNA polymerase sigma factor [Bacteroidales bacterium]MDD3989471.1 RNA polymerase sigma factor [Bacteroidales bacterium]MDD4639642.1 RNA polymerase sigma factor [Bacteroidales bacterium]